jgi:hypothetical protein
VLVQVANVDEAGPRGVRGARNSADERRMLDERLHVQHLALDEVRAHADREVGQAIESSVVFHAA